MRQKTFGRNPEGKRLEQIKKSPNYKEGIFQNLSPTEVTLKNASMTKMLKDYFNKPKDTAPSALIPSVKTDLYTLSDDKPTIVWFGHSSYLIQYKGTRILVDPVFSGYASPVSYFGKSFPGSDIYTVSDFGNIDMLIITHDHYDHMDYKTITQFAPKVKSFYTALGVGSHLEFWGIPVNKIVEFDWWDHQKIADSIHLTATPARHFSGRGLVRNKTLWTSFVLQLYDKIIYIGGDSGYDTHFKAIGDKYGPFDIVMLESGQYGSDWPYIHMFPEETVKAAQDLKAKTLLPVHWGKFVLANHAWNEPIQRVVQKAKEENMPLATPKIGEPIYLGEVYPNQMWWQF
ncbi:MBL fold metallo-hydrolase [Cytophagaceae bacterium YF14B1]|uniref:MBL fold metallo-hydrolase n=1 Tax=Xanthocytophaga flava TaxID=3048013 RepID=A0AAE3QMH4_9BACT|nr:MBL fold metallo-hydrolase [Xanthocytophaga flavus]MDJ1480043.1 MBL fold metallo-hydrolase [Xanthocytophaga flavus]